MTAGCLLLARLFETRLPGRLSSANGAGRLLTGVGFQVGIGMLDENTDLLGLSAVNAAAALSGTFVVNGSPTQTAMVERYGGHSQIAQFVTAAVVARAADRPGRGARISFLPPLPSSTCAVCVTFGARALVSSGSR